MLPATHSQNPSGFIQFVSDLPVLNFTKNEIHSYSNYYLLFQPDCMYYWTHTQTNISEKTVQDVNKLPPMWPPNLSDTPDKPGLKYTEAGMLTFFFYKY